MSSIGSRAAALTMKPVAGAMGAAAGAGMSLERRVIDRGSGELENLLASERFQALVKQVLDSDGAGKLVDTFFASRLFDRVVDALLSSDGLWRLIDEVVGSPAVTAAISQQGLGFADQVGTEVRRRSRRADDSLERIAQRVVHPRRAQADGLEPANP